MIVDTTVLVAAERGGSTLDALLDDEDDVAVAAVTAAELLVGVELADERHRAGRAGFVEAVLAELRIEPYEVATARAHAGLLATARRQGRPRGAHDLIIAATALDTDRAVVTADATGFDGLPGVRLLATG